MGGNEASVEISSVFAEAEAKRFTKYFRYNNSSYWQDYYAQKLLHVDTGREQLYAQLIKQAIGGTGRVADIGSGVGFLVRELARVGVPVIAVDLFDEMLLAARQYVQDTQVPFVQADILSLPFPVNSFDCISLMSVIEHFPKEEVVEDILPRIRTLIRPHGYLFIHVPVRSLHSRFARWFRRHIDRDLPPWAIDDDGDITHKMWLTAREYMEIVDQAGFTTVTHDFRLTRSNMKPKMLASLMSRLQDLLDLTAYQDHSLRALVRQAKSDCALTAYFMCQKRG